MTFHPLRGAVVTPDMADEVTTPPYDAMTPGDRAAWRREHPDSWLHVLPMGSVDDAELARCQDALARLHSTAFEDVPEPFVAVYQLTRDGVAQTGLVADLDVRAFTGGFVHAHERTRRSREEELARHLDVVRVHSSPVCLTHAPSGALHEALSDVAALTPRIELTDGPERRSATKSALVDAVTQRLWIITDPVSVTRLLALADQLVDMVVTDGHHRAAAAGRVATTDGDGQGRVLVALFPSNELTVAPFDRVLDIDPTTHLERLRAHLQVGPGGPPHRPSGPGQAVVATADGWFDVDLPTPNHGNQRHGLDVVRLERLLSHVADLVDPRGDERLTYSPGLGTEGLQSLVAAGDRVGWALWPTSIEDVIAIATAGGTLPPKSTYVVPKARSGLLLIPRSRTP